MGWLSLAAQSVETGDGLGWFGLVYVGFLVVGATLLAGYAMRKKPEESDDH